MRQNNIAFFLMIIFIAIISSIHHAFNFGKLLKFDPKGNNGRNSSLRRRFSRFQSEGSIPYPISPNDKLNSNNENNTLEKSNVLKPDETTTLSQVESQSKVKSTSENENDTVKSSIHKEIKVNLSTSKEETVNSTPVTSILPPDEKTTSSSKVNPISEGIQNNQDISASMTVAPSTVIEPTNKVSPSNTKVEYIIDQKEFEKEQVHLNFLNIVCVSTFHHSKGLPIISSTYNSEEVDEKSLIFKDDPQLYEKLSSCPAVDLYLPPPARNHGYCEDSMGFMKYLEGRVLPDWVLNIDIIHNHTSYSYFEICPETPIFFFNHYWDDVLNHPKWPKNKKILLMPNVEMYELREHHLWASDIVLCRTIDCIQRISKWYLQEGNPKNSIVMYTKGISSDPLALLRYHSPDVKEFQEKTFTEINFLHTPGKSFWKGTDPTLQCWKSHPEWPKLNLVYSVDWIKKLFQGIFRNQNPQNIDLNTGNRDQLDFARFINQSNILLCPSTMEGYGHYINQARASGALIVTTDGQPMNELVDESSGILVHVDRFEIDRDQFLGGTFEETQKEMKTPHNLWHNLFRKDLKRRNYGLRDVSSNRAIVTSEGVCNAIDVAVNQLTVEERAQKAANARKKFEQDSQFFKETMKTILSMIKVYSNKTSVL